MRFITTFLLLASSFLTLECKAIDNDQLVIYWATRGTPQNISESETRDAVVWAITTWSQALLIDMPVRLEERPWNEADIRIAWDNDKTAPAFGSAIWPPLSLWSYDSEKSNQPGDWTISINSATALRLRPKNGSCYFSGPIWRGILLHEVGHNFGLGEHAETEACGTMSSATPWISDMDRRVLNEVWYKGQAEVHGAPEPTFPLIGHIESLEVAK